MFYFSIVRLLKFLMETALENFTVKCSSLESYSTFVLKHLQILEFMAY
jgi:hypothetical protein